MPITSKNKNGSGPIGASPRANNANGGSAYKEGDWTPFFKYLPKELTTNDILVYGQVRMRMNYQDGQSTASAQTIARETRMSTASVWKSIKRLINWNMIARTKSGKRNGQPSYFIALEIDQWKLEMISKAVRDQDEDGSLPDEEGVSTPETPGLYQVDTGSLLHRHQVSTTWTQEEAREQPFINDSEEELAQSRTKESEFESEEYEAVHTVRLSPSTVQNKKEAERGLHQVDTPSLQDKDSEEGDEPEVKESKWYEKLTIEQVVQQGVPVGDIPKYNPDQRFTPDEAQFNFLNADPDKRKNAYRHALERWTYLMHSKGLPSFDEYMEQQMQSR